MATLTLPIDILEDATKHSIGLIDNTQETNTESGYIFTRPRSTRNLRRAITIGYTDLSNDEKLELEQFVQDVKGKAIIFFYIIPFSGEIVDVRFKEVPAFIFAGYGANNEIRWDWTGVQMESV